MPYGSAREQDKASNLEFEDGNAWLNTAKPLKLKELRGKVVLLDFWTLCCINCMHIIPDLKKLEAKYPNELVVIGVHTGKFENEKDIKSIREAVLRYGIKHPVVNDADYKLWERFGSHGWPTLVLIDVDGKIIGSVSGEGHYQELDTAISVLIRTAKQNGSLKAGRLNFLPEENKRPDSVLKFPGKIISDAEGKRLFISDSGHNRIVICDEQGSITAVIGSGKEGKQDGSFASAKFNHPQGLAHQGNLVYIADTENHCLRLADLKSRTVTTIAGTGTQSYSRAGGNATSTGLSSPWDLCLIGNKLYIAMAGMHQLWQMDLKKKTISPYAGSGREEIHDGPAQQAALAQPSGLTTDGKKLYFADSEVSAIRSCSISDAPEVETLIGSGLFNFGDADGELAKAKLQHPLGVLFNDGILYVADTYNHKIKSIDLKTKTCRTLFGTGKMGSLNAGKTSLFSEPSGLALLGKRLFVADTDNDSIRVCDLASGKVNTIMIKTGYQH